MTAPVQMLLRMLEQQIRHWSLWTVKAALPPRVRSVGSGKIMKKARGRVSLTSPFRPGGCSCRMVREFGAGEFFAPAHGECRR